ncbi:hypothetical protein JTB14_014986 [Gonioctena quinquepunctata]|nr:hypothetical protein JTB14_014986 [Gonioctena quinquepunctata]
MLEKGTNMRYKYLTYLIKHSRTEMEYDVPQKTPTAFQLDYQGLSHTEESNNESYETSWELRRLVNGIALWNSDIQAKPKESCERTYGVNPKHCN